MALISQTTYPKRIFLNEDVWISIQILFNFVPKGLNNNIPALVQIMAWCRPDDKPLYEPMMVSLLTHQWVNADPGFHVSLLAVTSESMGTVFRDGTSLKWPAVYGFSREWFELALWVCCNVHVKVGNAQTLLTNYNWFFNTAIFLLVGI